MNNQHPIRGTHNEMDILRDPKGDKGTYTHHLSGAYMVVSGLIIG